VRLPRNVSPGAARRRSLLADLVGAIMIALGAIVFAAGIGVVAVFALVTLLILLPWVLVEAVVRRTRRRRARARRRGAPASAKSSV
jgi:Na+-transporting methylmalonyl-CoA/oxaloacetate decarboxylase gamma subunit